MDLFGTNFLSNNLMLPILDFFYGMVPSYGLAIVALTLVVRMALAPISAGQIRNMRRMKVAQPVMQKRVREIQERYKNDPAKQQEEMAKVYQEFGNPLAGCLPLILQLPILFALFATLRGSPFADVSYPVELEIVPRDQIVQSQPLNFQSHSIYVKPGLHYSIGVVSTAGNKLQVGDETVLDFRTPDGRSLASIIQEVNNPDLTPRWTVKNGAELVELSTENGQTQLKALKPGKVSLVGVVPGLAANEGFLFISALGQVGAVDSNGTIHWDTLILVAIFATSTYISQMITSQGDVIKNPQQDQVNKSLPLILAVMFLFFPLPAGVLMYMVIANLFQTVQTFILSREPLPEHLQKIVDEQKRMLAAQAEKLPFERNRPKKKPS
ncbi:MAG: membrane protein insertase YidC [Gloeomargarita sp. SKYBB_i_bin120]|nr:membrane protein insertase YidC [Gloeomargarita sp. SKYG98]MCS7291530.1 membrane protein insertase YidC [Gloeomargarita sp. SKYB120]MDW8177090.1 membrane protein insertase YidC [Gloeomargarita sp. SKYBB_i_bin120]